MTTTPPLSFHLPIDAPQLAVYNDNKCAKCTFPKSRNMNCEHSFVYSSRPVELGETVYLYFGPKIAHLKNTGGFYVNVGFTNYNPNSLSCEIPADKHPGFWVSRIYTKNDSRLKFTLDPSGIVDFDGPCYGSYTLESLVLGELNGPYWVAVSLPEQPFYVELVPPPPDAQPISRKASAPEKSQNIQNSDVPEIFNQRVSVPENAKLPTSGIPESSSPKDTVKETYDVAESSPEEATQVETSVIMTSTPPLSFHPPPDCVRDVKVYKDNKRAMITYDNINCENSFVYSSRPVEIGETVYLYYGPKMAHLNYTIGFYVNVGFTNRNPNSLPCLVPGAKRPGFWVSRIFTSNDSRLKFTLDPSGIVKFDGPGYKPMKSLVLGELTGSYWVVVSIPEHCFYVELVEPPLDAMPIARKVSAPEKSQMNQNSDVPETSMQSVSVPSDDVLENLPTNGIPEASSPKDTVKETAKPIDDVAESSPSSVAVEVISKPSDDISEILPPSGIPEISLPNITVEKNSKLSDNILENIPPSVSADTSLRSEPIEEIPKLSDNVPESSSLIDTSEISPSSDTIEEFSKFSNDILAKSPLTAVPESLPSTIAQETSQRSDSIKEISKSSNNSQESSSSSNTAKETSKPSNNVPETLPSTAAPETLLPSATIKEISVLNVPYSLENSSSSDPAIEILKPNDNVPESLPSNATLETALSSKTNKEISKLSSNIEKRSPSTITSETSKIISKLSDAVSENLRLTNKVKINSPSNDNILEDWKPSPTIPEISHVLKNSPKSDTAQRNWLPSSAGSVSLPSRDVIPKSSVTPKNLLLNKYVSVNSSSSDHLPKSSLKNISVLVSSSPNAITPKNSINSNVTLKSPPRTTVQVNSSESSAVPVSSSQSVVVPISSSLNSVTLTSPQADTVPVTVSSTILVNPSSLQNGAVHASPTQNGRDSVHTVEAPDHHTEISIIRDESDLQDVEGETLLRDAVLLEDRRTITKHRYCIFFVVVSILVLIALLITYFKFRDQFS